MKGNMATKEKMILVAMISTLLIFGFYALYVYQKYISVNPDIINNFRFWGKTFLILIPVTIVAQIIIHIVFAIINKIVTDEEISTIDDERDKIIDLKAIRISHWIFALGFFLAMGSQAIGMQPWVLFITLIASGLVSTILSGTAKLYFYRKGV
jgi:hypothetical protein